MPLQCLARSLQPVFHEYDVESSQAGACRVERHDGSLRPGRGDLFSDPATKNLEFEVTRTQRKLESSKLKLDCCERSVERSATCGEVIGLRRLRFCVEVLKV